MTAHLRSTQSPISSAELRHKALPLEVKKLDGKGTFTGYGSVFGVVDSYGEVVAPGAFRASLKEMNAKGRTLPVLWQHQTANPIGNWTKLEEDENGLVGVGELWLEEAPQALIAYKGLTTQAITGLSIGYYVKAYEVDEEKEQITLTEVRLVEISIVTSPANEDARIQNVRSRQQNLPTNVRELERALRSLGYSQKQATRIALHGFGDTQQEHQSSDEVLRAKRALQELVQSFKGS